MVRRYPQLQSMVKDPDAYFEKVNKQFKEQKKLTPDHPYSFDFSEFGLPLAKDIQGYLTNQLARLKEEQTQFQEKVSKRKAVMATALRPFDKRKLAEYELYTKYLSELKAEADSIVADNKVSYFHIVEFSYYYARAAGRFTTRTYPLKDRLMLKIDRALEGYKPLSLENEYSLYPVSYTHLTLPTKAYV